MKMVLLWKSGMGMCVSMPKYFLYFYTYHFLAEAFLVFILLYSFSFRFFFFFVLFFSFCFFCFYLFIFVFFLVFFSYSLCLLFCNCPIIDWIVFYLYKISSINIIIYNDATTSVFTILFC